MKIKITTITILVLSSILLISCSSSNSPSSEKDILSFSINGINGVINGTDISVTMPYGTDVSVLTPVILIPENATVFPGSGVEQDFTDPLDYTVTAQDNTTKIYTITVAVTTPDSKDILSFSILGNSGTISGTDISVYVPYETDVSLLTPTISINGKNISPASGVAQDFTTTLSYTVTAIDLSTKIYTVTVYESKPIAGHKKTFTADGINFNLMFVPGGLTFPRFIDDTTSATVADDYWIAETEVTYELWSTIYNWATTDAGGGLREDGGELYHFANPGVKGTSGVGNDTLPVTNMNWRDAMIFCNAITEWYNYKNSVSYTPSYYTDAPFLTPIRTSTNTDNYAGINTPCSALGCEDNPYLKTDATGFRLPTYNEWSLAARYKGNNSGNGAIELPLGSGNYWTPGTYSSGATDTCSDVPATELVAWIGSNSGSVSHEVKTRDPNLLGIYDMSGNQWEWNFNWYDSNKRMSRGGSYVTGACGGFRVGFEGGLYPWFKEPRAGFRIAKTH